MINYIQANSARGDNVTITVRFSFSIRKWRLEWNVFLALKDSVVRFELDPNKNREVGRFFSVSFLGKCA